MPTPKSKESKRKVRRWTFDVLVKQDDDVRTFQPNAVTIGSSRNAQDAAANIQADLQSSDRFKDARVTVKPVGHEVVSSAIVNQLNGLQDEGRLLGRAIKNLVTAQLTQAGVSETEATFGDQVRERMGQAVITARDDLMAEQKAKAEAVAQELGGELILRGELPADDGHVGPDGEDGLEGVDGAPMVPPEALDPAPDAAQA